MDRTLRSQADSSCAVIKFCQAEPISPTDGVTVLQTRKMGLLTALILSKTSELVTKLCVQVRQGSWKVGSWQNVSLLHDHTLGVLPKWPWKERGGLL